MSETVKLIIEIPKYYLKHPQDYACLAECVRRGTPFDDVKTRIEKEIIPRNSDDYDHDAMYQNCGLRMALKIIDNIEKGE